MRRWSSEQDFWVGENGRGVSFSEAADRLWGEKAWVWECEKISAECSLLETSKAKSNLPKVSWGVMEEKFEEGIEGLGDAQGSGLGSWPGLGRIVKGWLRAKVGSEVGWPHSAKFADYPQQHLEVWVLELVKAVFELIQSLHLGIFLCIYHVTVALISTRICLVSTPKLL